jgi:hypothetical protein
MRRANRRIEIRNGALVPAVAGALTAAALAVASCITGAPADPPQPPALGPTIIQDAVKPPNDEYLTVLPQLPSTFAVPVRVFNPNTPITCNVFVDFDPGSDNSQFAKGTAAVCPRTLPALDGGPTILTFSLSQASLAPGNVVDPHACHTIQCFVGDYPFSQKSAHTPGDSLGADSVTWQYTPDGPGSCSQFDAGDGAYLPDAPSDGGVLPGPPI